MDEQRLRDGAFRAMEEAKHCKGAVCCVWGTEHLPYGYLPTVQQVKPWRFVVTYWMDGEQEESDALEYQIALAFLAERLLELADGLADA